MPATALPDPRITTHRAHSALTRRLDQLEQDRDEFMNTLMRVQTAVRWLDAEHQPAARERLRRLGLKVQLDSFQDLVDVMAAA